MNKPNNMSKKEMKNKTLREEIYQILRINDATNEASWWNIVDEIQSKLTQREAEVREEMVLKFWKELDKKKDKLIEWDSEDVETETLTKVLRLRDVGDILRSLNQNNEK